MFSKTAILFCILGSITIAAAQTRATDLNSAGQSSAAPAASANPAARPDEVAALRDDIRKMSNLVQQMETNLTFVSDTQSPLKHQFELEIQMWKMMIGQMERRLDAIERR
jgi:hypothetical protein